MSGFAITRNKPARGLHLSTKRGGAPVTSGNKASEGAYSLDHTTR